MTQIVHPQLLQLASMRLQINSKFILLLLLVERPMIQSLQLMVQRSLQAFRKLQIIHHYFKLVSIQISHHLQGAYYL